MRETLNGYVVADDEKWLYDWFDIRAFSPDTVRQAIRNNPTGEELVLEVNSPGGSVFAGFEIYSVLRSARDVQTCVEIQSLAASAASTLMLGADRVMISPVAEVMIHLPATSTDGDRKAHRDSIRVLDTITNSILDGYEAKCRGRTSRDELRRMMNTSTWLTAREALDAGLVDGILYQDTGVEGGILPSSITNAVGGGLLALAGCCNAPNTATLLAQYQQLVAAGVRPVAEGHPVVPQEPAAPTSTPSSNDFVAPAGEAPAVSDDWRNKARLAIEKIRFL